MPRHEVACHCGQVRLRVEAVLERVLECNCSICTKKGFLHWIVQRDDVELLRGADALSEYRFGTGVARHLFCRHCGIATHYVPRSHPNGFSVNLRCVEGVDIESIPREPFDGANWERARRALQD